MLAMRQPGVDWSILVGKPHPQTSDLLLPDSKSKWKRRKQEAKNSFVILFPFLFYTDKGTRQRQPVPLYTYK